MNAITRTEVLLAATALFNNLDQTRLQLFDGRYVVGEHTHLARLRWEVHLDARSLLSVAELGGVICYFDIHILRLVDCLRKQMS